MKFTNTGVILNHYLFVPGDYIDELIDWREMQTLVRSMPDLHKTLVLVNVNGDSEENYTLEELAMATEHAPFRHRQVQGEVGSQRKKQRTDNKTPKG